MPYKTEEWKQADEAFYTAFRGHVNIMTREILERGIAGEWAWEISRGRWVDGEPIYGVTVIGIDGSRSDESFVLSKMFDSYRDATEHVRSLDADD